MDQLPVGEDCAICFTNEIGWRVFATKRLRKLKFSALAGAPIDPYTVKNTLSPKRKYRPARAFLLSAAAPVSAACRPFTPN